MRERQSFRMMVILLLTVAIIGLGFIMVQLEQQGEMLSQVMASSENLSAEIESLQTEIEQVQPDDSSADTVIQGSDFKSYMSF